MNWKNSQIRDLKWNSYNNSMFEPYFKIGFRIDEWTPKEMYKHLKKTITKAVNEALGFEQLKNKYLEKYINE